jgi:hypothetical protein
VGSAAPNPFVQAKHHAIKHNFFLFWKEFQGWQLYNKLQTCINA